MLTRSKEFLGKNEYIIFVFTRALILVSKPLILYFLIQGDYEDEATFLSVFFLAQGSLMIIFNNEAHFVLYNNLFSGKLNYRLLVIQRENYVKDVYKHIITFAPIVLGTSYLLIGNFGMSVAMLVVLVLDKIFDEVQRLIQFQKRFIRWSIISFIRIIPSYALSMIVLSFFQEISFSLSFVSFYLFFVALSILLGLNIKGKLFFFFLRKVVGKFNLWSYFHHFRKNLYLNQFQSILSKNIPQSDRLMIRFIDISILAEISIYSQIGTGAVLFVDYFIISHRRKEYLETGRKISSIVSYKKLFYFFLINVSIYVLVIITTSVFTVSSKHDSLTIQSQMLIYMSFVLYAFAQHFTNYNFWQRKRFYTISVELIYYAILFVFSIILSMVIPPALLTNSVLGAILFANFIRLGTSMYLSTRMI